MPLEDFRLALGALRDHGLFFLTLSGGDPFLHPEIDQLLRLAHDAFHQVSVLSSGTQITEENLATIRHIAGAKGRFPIQVSLDSVDPAINDTLRGSTETILANLGRLKAAGANITLAIVLSARNIDHVTETVLALRHQVEGFHIMPIKPVPYLQGRDAYLMVEPEKTERAWRALSALRDRYGILMRIPPDALCHTVKTTAHGAPCMAGFTKLAIDPNLDVRPCDKLVSQIVGNLRTESLAEIWSGERLAKIYGGRLPYCMVALGMDERREVA
jgi:MoaA/NifB/PqqE/SkfB family radical SAM enzyme